MILNPRSVPETIGVNRHLQPEAPVRIVAEVRGVQAPVTDVKFKIQDTAIVIPLAQVGDTIWRGELSPEQIRELAIQGQSVEYEATVIATDQNGVVARSPDPIRLSVQTDPAAMPG